MGSGRKGNEQPAFPECQVSGEPLTENRVRTQRGSDEQRRQLNLWLQQVPKSTKHKRQE